MISDLEKHFNELNSKYKKIIEIVTTFKFLKVDERNGKIEEAAFLWSDIKQDKAFIDGLYEKNKDPRIIQIFKQLDDYCALNEEIKDERNEKQKSNNS